MLNIKGSLVALVTPMNADGSLDKNAFESLIRWHIESQTDGIIIAGTTGESATLSDDEQIELVSIAVKIANGAIPIIAGTGTNNTKTTIERTNRAKAAGATAALIVTPYYNKPSQNGLFAHFQTIATACDFPIIAYNVPGRTGCDMLPDTIVRISHLPNLIGIKEATGDINRIAQIRTQCPPQFKFYSGDDATALNAIKIGAHGVISVTANIAPAKMHALCQAALEGEWEKAEAINQELSLLHRDLFVESNPVPTKWALAEMRKIQGGIRLPLLPLDIKCHEIVKSAMRHAGVLS